MLAVMTSRQLGEWMAFAGLEPVGKPVPPDPVEAEKAKRKQQRVQFESGMRALQQKGVK